MQGTLTPYEPIEVPVKTRVSRGVKRSLRGAPDPQSVTRHPEPGRTPTNGSARLNFL
jgi:hypothetical protein